MDCNLEGPGRDPMEDFGISQPRGSASRSCRPREEEEYMEGVRQGVLGGAYVEDLRCSHLDFEEEMDVAAVGTHQGPPVGTSVDLATGVHGLQGRGRHRAGRPEGHQAPMYDGNPFNLDSFLERLDNSGMTVTEDREDLQGGVLCL